MEKLTKTAIKNELTRRIEWIEKSYGFDADGWTVSDIAESPRRLIMYGRYLALREARFQVERGLFIGGFVC